MIDTAESVRRVLAANMPVLCVDTCVLLDLIRGPTREQFNDKHAEAALNLLGRVEAASPTLTLLIAEQVERELNDNAASVLADSERQIKKVDKMINRFIGAFGAVGISLPAAPNFIVPGFPAAAHSIVQRFLASALIVREEPVFPERAWVRVQHATAPAARGKQSMKDCVIIETYLHVVQQLRATGFAGKVVFFTTNTKDYAEGATPRLHSDLTADFSRLGLDFETSVLAVRYSL